jgi:hypothetical protein
MVPVIARLRVHWRALAVSCAIALLPFWEVVAGRRTTIYADAQEQFIPYYATVWRLIRDGHAPWWHGGSFSGFSLLGAGQAAVFYPPNALYGWLEATNATRWWLVLHLLIGVGGMYVWSYRRWRSQPGAIASAAAFALCSFHIFHLVHLNFFAEASWLPVAMLGVDLVTERWTTRRVLVLAGPIALMALLGGPQLLWLGGIGLAVYAAGVSLEARSRRRSDLRLVAAMALGLGMGAVQLLPSWLFSRTSVRPGLSMDDAFSYSMQPRHLLNLLFPYLYGGGTRPAGLTAPWQAGPWPADEVLAYAGVTALILALVGAWAHRREPVVWATLALATFGVLLALAGTTPLGRIFYSVLPMASGFRSWGRATVLTQLVIAFLAGAGVHAVLTDPRRALRPLSAGAAFVAVAALGAPRISSVHDGLVPGGVGLAARLLPVLLVALLLTAALVLVERPRLGAFLVVALVAVDLVTFARAGTWYQAGTSVADSTKKFDVHLPPEFGPTFDAPGGVDRWASISWYRGLALTSGTRTVQGYDPLLQEDYAETVGGLTSLGGPTRDDLWTHASLADVLRVTTLVLTADITPSADGWRRVGQVEGTDLVRWERRPRLPEAYLVGAAETADLDDIRDALADPDTPWARRAFVEGALLTTLDEPGAAGRVRHVDVEGDGLVEVTADRPALLVLSYAWMEGWTATVDGHDAPVVRTDGLVLGIPVPAGEHVVRLRYRPPGLPLGAAASAGSLLVLLAVDPVRRRVIARREHPPVDVPA